MSCQLYQRSADVGLGVPFNIASYALLTRIVAHCCDLKCGELIHVMGDVHIYVTHIEELTLQQQRTPTPWPKLVIQTKNKDIDGFVVDDFKLEGYTPQEAIKLKLSI